MRPNFFVFALLLSLVGAGSRALALDPRASLSDYILHHWDAENGLAQNAVKDLLQTSDGYLWIGTSFGVSRFDGLTFTNFRRAQYPEMAGDNITVLAETPDGSLWIGSATGLTRYYKGRFTAFSKATGLRADTINALQMAPDGSMWLGHREGITRWVNERFVDDIDTSDYDFLGMRNITVDSKGAMWITAGAFALRYADGKFTRFGREQGLPENGIQLIHEDAQGQLLAVTQSGLFFWDDSRFRLFERGTASHRLNTSYVDSDGNLWLGSATTLERYSAGQFITYHDPKGQPLGADRLLEDREGSLWIGNSSGLSRLIDRRARTLGYQEGVQGTPTLAVKETRDGSLWVSSWNAGVARFQNDRTTQYRLNAPLSHDSVTSIYEAPDGAVWLGHRGSGVDRLEGDHVTSYVYPPGVVSARYITAMHIEPDGEMLFGIANRGIFTLQDGAIVPLPDSPRLNSQNVWWIGRLRDQRLLAISTRGIFQRGEDRSWRLLQLPGFNPQLSVRGLLETDDGVIWLATDDKGLVEWRSNSARSYGMREGMLDDGLSSVLDDGQGFLWVTSARGIARIRKTELADVARGAIARINPVTFGRADGLLSGSTPNNAAAPVSARLSDGRLVFATDKGLAVINPRDVEVNTRQPPVVIEQVIADDKPLPLIHGQAVKVPAGTNRVEFRYTALSLIAPHRLLFRYQLAGSDPTWVEAGRERSARYTHLAPGSYVFRLLACNNDGIWSEAETNLIIAILPRFYETLWFRILTGAALLTAIGGAAGARVRQLKRRQTELARINTELDQRVRERTAELSRSHAEIEQRELLFRLIFEHAPVGISWSRTDLGASHHFNAAFRRILRLPAETLPDDSLLAQLTHREDMPRRAEMESRIQSGEANDYTLEQRFVLPDGEIVSALLAVAVVRDERGQAIQVIRILEDITPLKAAEQELANTYKRLVDASRMAGMAEVATGVLHNVGNVLNSVNVSATLLADGLRQSKASSIGKVSALLHQHAANLADFLTRDPKGQQVLPYLDTLTNHVAGEQQRLLAEVDSLRKNVEHIKEVVSRQQSYAHLGGLAEKLSASELFEDALRINLTGLTRHGIEIAREFGVVPPILADRHKVLQILVNLVQNAKQAVQTAAPGNKRIVLRLEARDRFVRFIVADNGVGIPPENLARIFSHGFTTRSGGHGFGLHSSANAAKEMRGSLTAHSEGAGRGATFILELPAALEEPAAPAASDRALSSPARR